MKIKLINNKITYSHWYSVLCVNVYCIVHAWSHAQDSIGSAWNLYSVSAFAFVCFFISFSISMPSTAGIFRLSHGKVRNGARSRMPIVKTHAACFTIHLWPRPKQINLRAMLTHHAVSEFLRHFQR